MRALAFLSAAVLAVVQVLFVAGDAQAEEICLYGGPDASADLACGPAHVAPARPMPVWSGRAEPQSRIESRLESGSVTRANGVAESRLLSGGRAEPALPALPSYYAAADAASAYPAPPPSVPYGAAPYAPAPYDYAAPAWPAPDANYYYDAQAAPPPPPSLGGYVSVQGSGPAPGTYAYAYESADGGAFAWRYDTPQGPAWAYAYETPEGWAYAYAYDTGGAGAPPPMIEARGIDASGAYRGPYVEHGAYAGFHNDWRYREETRLYGASYPRQLYLVETYYRDTGWQTVAVQGAGRTFIGCGACGASYAQGGHGGAYGGYYGAPAPRPGFIVSGGGGFPSGGGFTSSGSYLVGGGASGSASSASRSFSESNRVSVTDQAMASASGNQTVTAGRAFAPPSGAPTPPWGPPPNMAAGNMASASAHAGAASRAGR